MQMTPNFIYDFLVRSLRPSRDLTIFLVNYVFQLISLRFKDTIQGNNVQYSSTVTYFGMCFSGSIYLNLDYLPMRSTLIFSQSTIPLVGVQLRMTWSLLIGTFKFNNLLIQPASLSSEWDILLVSKRYGMSFYWRQFKAYEEPGISLWEIIKVPSISITKTVQCLYEGKDEIQGDRCDQITAGGVSVQCCCGSMNQQIQYFRQKIRDIIYRDAQTNNRRLVKNYILLRIQLPGRMNSQHQMTMSQVQMPY